MALALPSFVLYGLHIFTACALTLIFATDIYWLAKANYSFRIRGNIKPKYDTNIGFFVAFAVVAFLILSFLLAVVEICLMIKIKYAETFRAGFYRPVVYILMGIASMGICGDLGLASGIILMIAGAFWLIITLLAGMK